MGSPSSHEITRLLALWCQGDEQAVNALMPLVDGDLRRLAAYLFRGERSGHTLQPTALVNEAYLKLDNQSRKQWQDRAHFFAVAARAMREILVDHARKRRRGKRGGGVAIVPLEEGQAKVGPLSIDVLALHEALNRFAALNKRAAQMMEMRYFAGLSNEGIARLFKVSATTVERDLALAKAWLGREMSNKKNE